MFHFFKNKEVFVIGLESFLASGRAGGSCHLFANLYKVAVE